MLEDTGERVIPEKMKITNNLLLEHLARYHFAASYTKGRVLDLASGSGYGSHVLAKLGKKVIDEVIGVDIDAEAIEYAKKTHYHPLTTYQHKDVTDPELPDDLGEFDTIVSFETIEHVEEEEQFLSNIYNMVKPGGTLILSTPFGKGRGKPCGSPFHVHQVTIDEFKEMFTPFKEKSFYYQKGPLIVPAKYSSDHYPLGIVVAKR